jgi:hypothetical protein
MISCLCVTHERPEFMPWLEHQFLKNHGDDLLIIDSSAVPWVSAVGRVVHAPSLPGISEKRTLALSLAQSDFVTWFDDDDWQHPYKLENAWRFSDYDDIDAVGSRTALMYSTLTGKCSYYESRYEPIIFNSATYLKSAVPPTFNEALLTGEDTDWHERFFRSHPNFVTLGEPQHAWLCHTRNITNKSSSKFFTQPCTIPFDEWERDFLAKLVT